MSPNFSSKKNILFFVISEAFSSLTIHAIDAASGGSSGACCCGGFPTYGLSAKGSRTAAEGSRGRGKGTGGGGNGLGSNGVPVIAEKVGGTFGWDRVSLGRDEETIYTYIIMVLGRG